MCDTQLTRRSTCGNASCPPFITQMLVFRRAFLGFSTEFDPSRLGGRNTLRLPLMDKFPLGLGNIGQQL